MRKDFFDDQLPPVYNLKLLESQDLPLPLSPYPLSLLFNAFSIRQAGSYTSRRRPFSSS